MLFEFAFFDLSLGKFMGTDLTTWEIYVTAIFFLACVVFIFYAVCRFMAGPSGPSVNQLIKQEVIGPSALNDICISQIGGRLTINKYSFPLQFFGDSYRRRFNDYLSRILPEIRNINACSGKFDCLVAKGLKKDYARIIVLALILLAYLWARLADALPPLIDLGIYIGFGVSFLLLNDVKWKLSDENIQFRNGLIELKEIVEIQLFIAEKEIRFELEVNTTTSKYRIMDSKLKRLLPIIAIINQYNSDCAKNKKDPKHDALDGGEDQVAPHCLTS